MKYYHVERFNSHTREATWNLVLYLSVAASLAISGTDTITEAPLFRLMFYGAASVFALGAVIGNVVDVRRAVDWYSNHDFDNVEVIFSAVVATKDGFQFYYVATEHHSGRQYNDAVPLMMRMRFQQWIRANKLTYVRDINDDDRFFLEARI